MIGDHGGFIYRTAGEVLEEYRARKAATTQWGPWHLRHDNLTLEISEPFHYYVDLEECLTSAQVLDHICQVTAKGYGAYVNGSLGATAALGQWTVCRS